ncbi:HORMA domain-containing protein 1 [Pholidichthys leucotaenia]
MACAQQARTSQNIQPIPSEVVSEQQSLLVIKRLLTIAVSGITYLRGIFPEKAYRRKYMEDQRVMILSEEQSCPGVNQVIQWMQGCFDAIQKKYVGHIKPLLRTVVISICTDPENPQKVTEYYQVRIQYTSKGAQMDFESSKEVKVSPMPYGNTRKASILLVRKLYTLMQNLGPLPEDVSLNMKVAYYDDVTPPDYQPPGFREADSDTLEFEQEPIKLAMGEVTTPFHFLKLDMGTERQRVEQVEESVHVREKWVLKIEEHDIVTQSHVSSDVEESHTKNTNLDNTDIELSCHEKIKTCEEVTEKDYLVKKTSDTEVGLKKTRSGHIIKSRTETNLTDKKKQLTAKEKTASQFEIPTSQQTPSKPAPMKKRKFSEPKDRY